MAETSTDMKAGSRKQEKRAKRDAERAAKFRNGVKKTELAAVPEDHDDSMVVDSTIVPGEDGVTMDVDPVSTEVGKTTTSSKKRKREITTNDDEQQDSHKRKSIAIDGSKDNKKRKVDSKEDTEEPGRKKFIVFCGNLPWSTTDQALEKHFEKLKPFSLRHRTDPQTNKSKGFAFIEFENYDRLKTCLKLYHHTYFDPDDPNAKDPELDPSLSARDRKKIKGRRINVNLSAGGGGNTEARKEKIRVKNEKLDGQRQRRQEFERKEKEKERKKKLRDGGSDDKNAVDKPGVSGHGEKTPSDGHRTSSRQSLSTGKRSFDRQRPNAGDKRSFDTPNKNNTGESTMGIHPSRLARLN